MENNLLFLQKRHCVYFQYEPVITPGNELHVHHVVLYYVYNVDRALNGTVYTTEKIPKHVSPKYNMFSWNKGSQVCI